MKFFRIKILLKNICFFVLNIFCRSRKKASILMYHSVGDNGAFFTVQKNIFEKQLAYLKDKNFRVIFLSELVSRLEHGEDVGGCVSITFDDGYKDNFTAVLPLLEKYSFPATFFISTGYIDGHMVNSEKIELPMMSRDELLRAVSSNLVECMPHTRNHKILDSLNKGDMQNEIIDSRKDIEEITGKKAALFSYPKGRYTKEAIEYLKNLGFEAAVTVHEGLVSKDSDFFLLNRNSIDSSTSFVQFGTKLTSAIECYNVLKRWLKF